MDAKNEIKTAALMESSTNFKKESVEIPTLTSEAASNDKLDGVDSQEVTSSRNSVSPTQLAEIVKKQSGIEQIELCGSMISQITTQAEESDQIVTLDEMHRDLETEEAIEKKGLEMMERSSVGVVKDPYKHEAEGDEEHATEEAEQVPGEDVAQLEETATKKEAPEDLDDTEQLSEREVKAAQTADTIDTAEQVSDVKMDESVQESTEKSSEEAADMPAEKPMDLSEPGSQIIEAGAENVEESATLQPEIEQLAETSEVGKTQPTDVESEIAEVEKTESAEADLEVKESAVVSADKLPESTAAEESEVVAQNEETEKSESLGAKEKSESEGAKEEKSESEGAKEEKSESEGAKEEKSESEGAKEEKSESEGAKEVKSESEGAKEVKSESEGAKEEKSESEGAKEEKSESEGAKEEKSESEVEQKLQEDFVTTKPSGETVEETSETTNNSN